MNIADIINTKAGQDLLNNGKLPPVEIKIQTESLIILAVVTVVAALIIMLTAKILK